MKTDKELFVPGNKKIVLNYFINQNFKFAMRQVVRCKSKPGTVIGRADHAKGEPTYLVRDIESASLTHGVARRESELTGV